MDDLHSLTNHQLRKYKKMLPYGTQEWWELHSIQLFRRWRYLHGETAAKEMLTQWKAMRLEAERFDEWYAQQLELEL